MDPIQKVIDWQLRSLDFDKLREAAADLKRPWTLEDRLLEALDAMILSDRLSWRERRTLEDRQLGYTNREIAKREGVTERAIEFRINKMRQKFRDLDEYGV